MFCYKCGNEVSVNAKFCPKCGMALGNGGIKQNDLDSTIQQKEKKSFFKLLISPKVYCPAMGAMVLLALVIGLFEGNKDNTSEEKKVLKSDVEVVSDNVEARMAQEPAEIIDLKAEEKLTEKVEEKAEQETVERIGENTLYAQGVFVEPFGEEMYIDTRTRTMMNMYLSYFSEFYFFQYDKDTFDINEIVSWAFCMVNDRGEYEYETRPGSKYEYYEKMSLDKANQITEQYFGITISENMASSVNSDTEFYEDGYFYIPAADGEAYVYLSIISKVEDLGDGRLKLYYSIYSQDDDAYSDLKDKNYSQTNEEALQDPEYEYEKSGYAIVRENGSTYILEHLEEYENNDEVVGENTDELEDEISIYAYWCLSVPNPITEVVRNTREFLTVRVCDKEDMAFIGTFEYEKETGIWRDAESGKEINIEQAYLTWDLAVLGRTGYSEFAVVNAPDGYVNLRKGPGTEHEIIRELYNGEELTVDMLEDATASNGKKWKHVYYYDQDDYIYEGWVIASQIKIDE